MIVVDCAAVVDALTAVDGTDDLRSFLAQEERWPSGDGLRRRSFQLRENLSAYDAAYVALAEALNCSLLTRDTRLERSSGHLISVEVR